MNYRNYENYQELALAIVKQAALDYRNNKKYRKGVVKFFLSRWYRFLTKIPAEEILIPLMREVCKK